MFDEDRHTLTLTGEGLEQGQVYSFRAPGVFIERIPARDKPVIEPLGKPGSPTLTKFAEPVLKYRVSLR